MVVKILIWNTVKDKNKDYWKKRLPPDLCLLAHTKIKPQHSKKPVQHQRWIVLERYLVYFKAIPCQFTGLKWKSHTDHHVESCEIPNGARKPHSQIHSWLPLVIDARANTRCSCSFQSTVYPWRYSGNTHTHYIHPPYTTSSSFRLWGRDCLTRCQAEFTCLTTDWVLGIGKGSAVIGQFSWELHISANNLSCTLGLTENKVKAINEAVYI